MRFGPAALCNFNLKACYLYFHHNNVAMATNLRSSFVILRLELLVTVERVIYVCISFYRKSNKSEGGFTEFI